MLHTVRITYCSLFIDNTNLALSTLVQTKWMVQQQPSRLHLFVQFTHFNRFPLLLVVLAMHSVCDILSQWLFYSWSKRVFSIIKQWNLENRRLFFGWNVKKMYKKWIYDRFFPCLLLRSLSSCIIKLKYEKKNARKNADKKRFRALVVEFVGICTRGWIQ